MNTAPSLENPFERTKATEYTDDQIKNYWVDLPNWKDLLRPTSPTPIVVRGSKGSGKTHLLRYCSYQIQKATHANDLRKAVKQNRYLGIYFRGKDINVGRFRDKGQPPSVWADVYPYYLDLWLAEITIGALIEFLADHEAGSAHGRSICADVAKCFVDFPNEPPESLVDLKNILAGLRREVDRQVNNSALTRKLSVQILATKGHLVFGVPAAAARHVPELASTRFLYLIDEIEELTVDQQKYLQTLMRNRADPSSFRLGVRLYGLRTFDTDSGEQNRVGSEFDLLNLDEMIRAEPRTYNIFARKLCHQRLVQAGFVRDPAATQLPLDTFFQQVQAGKHHALETAPLVAKFTDRDRPYFTRLKKHLETAIKGQKRPKGVSDPEQIAEVLAALKCDEYPLLEKLNVLTFYQEWYRSHDLMAAAREVQAACREFIETESKPKKYAQRLSHFKSDLLAQLYSECAGKRPVYAGFDTFIEMSQGVPRYLLTTLKNIFKWSVFYGEQPFSSHPISLRAQQKGIADSAEWFFEDAQSDDAGPAVRNCVQRLAELFREVRFSDKPSECSLVTFSFDGKDVSGKCRQAIEQTENWSFLIHVPRGQLDRNSERVDKKYQLNCMLAPKWGLPIARRGAIKLSTELMNAIFDESQAQQFQKAMKRRIQEMQAPHFGRDRSAHPTLALDLFDEPPVSD